MNEDLDLGQPQKPCRLCNDTRYVEEETCISCPKCASWWPTHRHIKSGNVYRVIATAMHTETRELLTIYDNESRILWARPKAMFDDGRFEPLE